MSWESVKNWFVNFAKTTGWDLLKSVLILVAGIIIIKIIIKVLKKIFAKTKLESITISFLISITKFMLYTFLVLIVFSALGIEITGLLALLTTASLAIGLALQDSLSNLANGIIIITTKPFAEGDFVNINGVEGTIKHIKMLNTTLISSDGKIITLPNSSIVTSNVTNYNKLGKRRVEFNFEVAYESDVKQVNEIILNVINSNGKTYKDPAPFVSLKNLNASALNFYANCWVDSEDYWDVYYYVLNNVFNEFKKQAISVPYNQMEVRLRDDSVELPFDKKPLEKRVEKTRIKEEPKNILTKMIQKTKKDLKKDKKNSKSSKIKKTKEEIVPIVKAEDNKIKKADIEKLEKKD